MHRRDPTEEWLMSVVDVKTDGPIVNSAGPRGRRIGRVDMRAVRSVVMWTLIVALCLLLGELGSFAGVPAPHLLASLLVGAIAALSGAVRGGFPRPATSTAQAGVGVLMGSYVSPDELLSVGATVLPLLGITLATIGLCLGTGLVLSRIGCISLSDGMLSMVPGGSAAIVAAAEELRSDSRLVAFAQYLRVALVALTAPVVAFALNPAGHAAGHEASRGIDPTTAFHLVQGPQLGGLLVLLVVCVVGVQLGRRMSLPAATLLGPMILAALFVFTGAAHGFAPTGALRDALFAGVGLEVGLRFTRRSVRHIGRLLPHVLAGTVLVCVVCAGLAWMLAALIHMPVMDAYLATTPGGINAVLAAAASTDSNISVISTVQSARLFVVMLITPPIVRWMATTLGRADG